MKRKICTFGAVCAVLLTACGKTGNAVLTTADTSLKGSQPSAGKIQVETMESQVITVTSREAVQVIPDKAELIYAVTTQNEDAARCQSENSEKLNQLVETLKSLGVEEASIQTSGFDLNPRYDWERNGVIVGYEAVTQVTVSDVDLDRTGEIIARSVESGVNQIQSVSFLSSQYDEKYQEALALAVARAQDKAQALADASGCTLGQAVRITEYTADESYRYEAVNTARAVAKKEAATMDMAVVMPGEIEVEARISVEYAIQ